MAGDLASSKDVLAEAKALEPLLLAHRDEAERARHLPVEVVRGLQAAGVTRISVPRAYGGLELPPAVQFEVVEALSRIDGAVGWCSLIAASLGYFAAFLDPAAAREVLADPGVIGAGAMRPVGRAERVAGGFRVTGRWPFASNARHATWMFGGCTVLEGGEPQRDAAGQPQTLVCVFPAADCRLLDTWVSTGLCGSGSVDFAVEDGFVPARLTFNPATSPLGQAGPLYRLRTMYLMSHSAVVLGIARAAIDATVALMAHKTRVTGTALRDEPYAQMAIAKAEALVASART